MGTLRAARSGGRLPPTLGVLIIAFYISIEKLNETAEEATFRFYDTAYPDEAGELRLNKADGEITMIKDTRQTFFVRAARKVAVAHKSGQLPDFLEWAS